MALATAYARAVTTCMQLLKIAQSEATQEQARWAPATHDPVSLHRHILDGNPLAQTGLGTQSAAVTAGRGPA